jgi:cytochrome c biogenesis protein CcmG, thiol:disulfide interchange protein DsbE
MSVEKRGVRDRLTSIFGGLVVIGLLFLVVAPETVWLSAGTEPVGQRKALSELKLPDLGGREWKLSEQRGKVVLVNLWATWCPPCREETPLLVRLSKDYKAKGLEVVGVSLDQGGKGVIEEFVAEYGVPYPILLPVPGSAITRIEPIPTTLLVDRQGRLAKKYVGAVPESVIKKDVESLLAEP